MIPDIETIVEDLIAGKITKSQAVSWLHQHAEDAVYTLRDEFAAKAACGILAGWNISAPDCTFNPTAVANRSFLIADAMLEARKK